MKKFLALIFGIILAILFVVFFVERVPVGNVGVVTSMRGTEDEVLNQGWHIVSPLKSVKEFPISQQQIVFSNNPGDYNEKEHPDWSIDVPTDGGMVKVNMTVNYNFIPEKVVELYSRFNGMDGEAIVASRVQNSIIAYTKEVTPSFSVMDVYADKKSEVNEAITNHLNEKLEEEYGIHVSDALIIDVQLDETLKAKVQAKEQAKQDAEIAELEKQTALAQAETDKVVAQASADVKLIEAEAEAEANKIISQSITPELIQMKEAEARQEHGWITTITSGDVITNSN